MSSEETAAATRGKSLVTVSSIFPNRKSAFKDEMVDLLGPIEKILKALQTSGERLVENAANLGRLHTKQESLNTDLSAKRSSGTANTVLLEQMCAETHAQIEDTLMRINLEVLNFDALRRAAESRI